jgi:hypothetical protein
MVRMYRYPSTQCDPKFMFSLHLRRSPSSSSETSQELAICAGGPGNPEYKPIHGVKLDRTNIYV